MNHSDISNKVQTPETDLTMFYEHNKFRFFTEKDKDDDTRLMYFDLKDFG